MPCINYVGSTCVRGVPGARKYNENYLEIHVQEDITLLSKFICTR